MSRGQALVELAVCAPIALILGLGAAASVQVAEASAGLAAATQSAAAAAARAPDRTAAQTAARSRFAAIVAAYPLRQASLSLDDGGLVRGGTVIATSTAQVDAGWAALVFTPRTFTLHASATAEVEPWRSRG